jgi:hypothetical protein
MALAHSPSIVRNGLVLCLDAANPKSYPGSGTAWNDISNNGNNGALVNGPTYNSSDNGNIIFDGVNDYAEITVRNTNLEFQPQNPFTLLAWVKTNTLLASSASGAILSNMVGSTPFTGYDLWINGSNQIACHLISAWSTNAAKVKIDYNYSNFFNQFRMISITYDGSSPTTLSGMLASMNFYTDGALNATGKAEGSAGVDGFDSSLTTIPYSASQRFRVGSRWSASAWIQGASPVIGISMVYNRALTAAEISQNFNALRGRYGI